MEDKIKHMEKTVTFRIIQEDAETLYAIINKEHGPVFAIGILPYYALFVRSCQEYMGKSFFESDVTERIKDIRNYIKAYSDGFGKSKRRIAGVDSWQNEKFQGMLKFCFMKKWNIHFNLGIYFTADKHIVANTQMIADFLEVKNMFGEDAKGRCFELGKCIGSFVSSVRSGLIESRMPSVIIKLNSKMPIKYYYDLNTNKSDTIFKNNKEKELNLFYLNLLCSVNFVKFQIRTLLDDDNKWLFRVEYIVTFYVYRALQRLKNYCDNNNDIIVDTDEILKLTQSGEKLFESNLRNCMMHYNLEGAKVLSAEHIEKPLFGIIENCFEGMDYYTYFQKLRDFENRIILYLENKFSFNDINLQEL